MAQISKPQANQGLGNSSLATGDNMIRREGDKKLNTQASYQTNASIEREIKQRKKSNVSNQSLVFQRNVKQQIEQLDQLQRKFKEGPHAKKQHEIMNESAPINISSIRAGTFGGKSKVQASNSIQNIPNTQEKTTKLGLIENLQSSMAYTNTLGNTLTKTMQSMSNALQAENSYSITQEKVVKSTQNSTNFKNNFRIDKNQIIQF